MRILARPSADRATVERNLIALAPHPRFPDEMLGPLWAAALRYAVDPVGVVAQSFKETGGGHFAGRVRPEFFNTAGVKNRVLGLYPGVDDGDQPLAHARFASWDVGAVAHVQHVRAYANAPVGDLIVDPRYVHVIGRHACESFADLGGKWAPSPVYGTELEQIAGRLAAR